MTRAQLKSRVSFEAMTGSMNLIHRVTDGVSTPPGTASILIGLMRNSDPIRSFMSAQLHIIAGRGLAF